MSVFKDEKTNKWYAMVRFTDWQGQRKQKCKRGFATRRDALEWEKVFQMQTTSDMDMSFETFVELYKAERQPRLKQTTWMTKEHIINTKILLFFGKRRISEIQSKDVIAWQNKLLLMKDEKGKPYSPVYLKTIHNQLRCVGCGQRKPPVSGAGSVEIPEWRGTSHDAEFPGEGTCISK